MHHKMAHSWHPNTSPTTRYQLYRRVYGALGRPPWGEDLWGAFTAEVAAAAAEEAKRRRADLQTYLRKRD